VPIQFAKETSILRTSPNGNPTHIIRLHLQTRSEEKVSVAAAAAADDDSTSPTTARPLTTTATTSNVHLQRELHAGLRNGKRSEV
jgi:hypothetical protein